MHSAASQANAAQPFTDGLLLEIPLHDFIAYLFAKAHSARRRQDCAKKRH